MGDPILIFSSSRKYTFCAVHTPCDLHPHLLSNTAIARTDQRFTAKMRSSIMIVAPFVAAAYAQSSAPANGTEGAMTSSSSYSYSNDATQYLTQTDSRGVITGQPAAATSQPSLPAGVSTQPQVATVPAALVFRPTPRSLRVPLVVLLRPPPSPLRHPIQTLPRRAARPALPLPAPPTATATAALLPHLLQRTAPLRALRPALLLTPRAPTQLPPTSTWRPPALLASVRSSPPSCEEKMDMKSFGRSGYDQDWLGYSAGFSVVCVGL